MDKMCDFVQKIYSVKEKHPELRICQIISNAARLGGWNDNDTFYCPDDVVVKGLDMILDNNNCHGA